MHVTATLINLYHVCKRELWLHAHEIRMEHTSDTVTEGRLIGENSYAQRSETYTEVEMEGIKIDYFDAKRKVVHEVKKSDKIEVAHIAQVKYYLYVLHKNGIEGATAVIEYPTLRKTETVTLEPADFARIEAWKSDIENIVASEHCPAVINAAACKKCSYFEFCYCGE